MRLPRLALALLALVLMGRPPAQAEGLETEPVIGGVTMGCMDFRGVVVRTTMMTDLGDVGRAWIISKMPIIALDPDRLRSLPPKLQIFFYGHECAHHVLGQGSSASSPSPPLALLRDDSSEIERRSKEERRRRRRSRRRRESSGGRRREQEGKRGLRRRRWRCSPRNGGDANLEQQFFLFLLPLHAPRRHPPPLAGTTLAPRLEGEVPQERGRPLFRCAAAEKCDERRRSLFVCPPPRGARGAQRQQQQQQ